MNEISFKDFNKSMLGTQTGTQPLSSSHQHAETSTKSYLNESVINKQYVSGNKPPASQHHHRSAKQTASAESNASKAPFYPAGISKKSVKKSTSEINSGSLMMYDKESREILFSTWTPLRDEDMNSKVMMKVFKYKI